MKQALIYGLKVWLTTVVLGMRIAALIKIITDTDHLIYKFEDIFNSAIYDIPVGLIACLPSWILFSFITKYVNRTLSPLVYKKLRLTLPAIVLAILPFALLFGYQLTHINYLPDMLPEIFGYMIITVGGVWFYKLRSV